MNKKLVAVAVATTLGLTGLAGVSMASAQSAGPADLVDTISTKFNLNKAEVQAIFDDHRQARHAEREQAYQDRLATAVSEGKLTQEQADKLLAKHEEKQTLMQNLQGKSHDERHKAMEGQHEELEQWAEDNGIPEEYLFMGSGMHGQGGMRGGHGPGGHH